MKKIIDIIKNDPAFQVMQKGSGDIVTNETSGEAYLIASAFCMHPHKMMIVKSTQYEALQLYRILNEMLPRVCYFPADESLRVESIAYSYELLGERINAMEMLSDEEPCVCIMHMHSAVRYVSPPRLFKKHSLTLQKGDIIEPLELRKKLLEMGYMSAQRVDSPFYMSKRGGVVDVYSIQYDDPIRIEFFDDEIDTITFYNKDTQRRFEEIDVVKILPATDMLYDDGQVEGVIEKIEKLAHQNQLDEDALNNLEENVAMDEEALRAHDYSPRLYQYLNLFEDDATILDYAPDAQVITASYEKILDVYKRFDEENFYYFHEIQGIGEMVKGLHLVHDPQDVLQRRSINFSDFKERGDQVEFLSQSVQIPLLNEKIFLTTLRDYLSFNKVVFALENQHQIDLLIRLFEDNGFKYTLIGNDDHIYDGINMYVESLPVGIELPQERVVIITAKEVFKGSTNKKSYVKYKDAKVIHDYNELNVGDYVVHDQNGIGQYMGIKTLEVKGVHKDFLYIAYAGNDILYVPVENFKMIRKYASRDGKPPKLHALNSTKWQKEKAKVRAKVDGLADELINLYAQRMAQPGFAFAKDNDMQREFEESFGYELTPDQQRSVDEIKHDMEQPRPMDRLLCGDVGFGKTEVALRACFKAILSGKQCAFLCPTTILSSQHYHTMTKRFEGFAVNVALLNRFTSAKEKKQILADLKDGKIDLLVGTHRILSKDVVFKDIGLLCIDEEQRFGVRQKEKIKEYRKTIDVLTLTATPIPRTLQMSLMGVRGLSQIETPPKNRLPVQTYVSERSEPLIQQVIERELARDGQVFYLHNKTESIDETAAMVQRLVPQARIGIGHGKMDKAHLERVMQSFVDHEFDVLVCTTIIETGIDIPNANTIIVEDADRFGLAQLYQIKGRVGRSNRMAYAYLLYRKQKVLSEEANNRLKAIKEFTQLGSGYKIAMRDLSIRGSGDILGGEQAGFIDTVGFDMYMKILQEALDEKQGKKAEKEAPATNVSVDGYIPENYVESDMEKLNLYQRVYKANKMSELKNVKGELKDLYGQLPREVENIVDKRYFEILASDDIVEDVLENNNGLKITFTKDYTARANGIELFSLSNRIFQKKAKLSYEDGTIAIVIKEQDQVKYATEFLREIIKKEDPKLLTA